MKLGYGPGFGALFTRIREGAIEESVRHADGVYLDVGEGGHLLGTEFLSLEEPHRDHRLRGR